MQTKRTTEQIISLKKKRLIRCKFYSVSSIYNKLRGEASLYGRDQ